MRITDTGLVLREVKTGESSRILTLLTSRHGILSVSAKASMNPKSKLFSAAGMFCYSEWTLREGKSSVYWIDEASPIEVFFNLRDSIEALSVATYIAELLQILSPAGEEGGRLLLLALRSLHRMAEHKTAPVLVKAVFELRGLAEAGFMPDLSACAYCGRDEGGLFYFDERQGEVYCEDCAVKLPQERYENLGKLSPGALKAMRYIVETDGGKEYGFTLGKRNAEVLEWSAERYLLTHLDYPPKSLSFLKTII